MKWIDLRWAKFIIITLMQPCLKGICSVFLARPIVLVGRKSYLRWYAYLTPFRSSWYICPLTFDDEYARHHEPSTLFPLSALILSLVRYMPHRHLQTVQQRCVVNSLATCDQLIYCVAWNECTKPSLTDSIIQLNCKFICKPSQRKRL